MVISIDEAARLKFTDSEHVLCSVNAGALVRRPGGILWDDAYQNWEPKLVPDMLLAFLRSHRTSARFMLEESRMRPALALARGKAFSRSLGGGDPTVLPVCKETANLQLRLQGGVHCGGGYTFTALRELEKQLERGANMFQIWVPLRRDQQYTGL